MVFQLEVYYKVDRLLPGLPAQQKGTTARWYSNKTSLNEFLRNCIVVLDLIIINLSGSKMEMSFHGIKMSENPEMPSYTGLPKGLHR